VAFAQFEVNSILHVIEEPVPRPEHDRMQQEPQLIDQRSSPALPFTVMVLPSSRLSRETASAVSPFSTVVFCQSGDSRVVEATYFWVLFIQSAFATSLPRSGQEAAKTS
jgi:hypothetical protein